MKLTKSQLGAGLLIALVVAATGAVAYTVVFTGGAGTAYTAENGLTVETATDHGFDGTNPFLANNDTIYLDGVKFSASDTTSLTATDFAAEWTNTTNVDATNASIEIAPDDRPNVTVSGTPTQFDVGNITVNDGDTDLVIDGSGTTTVTPEGLPTDTTVYAVDASGKIIAKNTTDVNGVASFNIDHNTTVRVPYANGDLVQTFADSNRHVRFETGVMTQSPPLSLDANSGPNVTITGSTDVDVTTPFPFSNTVDLTTAAGSAEFTGSGGAATVDAANIEGQFTNLTAVDASTNAIQVDPADKAQLTIDGAATEVAFSDYALDDGSVDTVIAGPDGTSTELTYTGLQSGLTVTAVNASTGTPLDVAEVDQFGNLAVDIPHSESQVLLQSGDQTNTPEQTDASPVGDQSTEPAEFSVNVTDLDFPDDEVTVTIDADGSQVHQETITSNNTVTASIPQSSLEGGEHEWSVNATDRFGNTEIAEYDYTIPSQVYIYNETRNATGQYELIDDTANVRATLTGSDGLVVEQTVNNGVFDLEGYDPTQTYILTVETNDYFVRSVYLPNLYEQQAIFLLNQSRDSTESLISLDDRTGNFDDNPVLQTQRVINTSNVSLIPDNGFQWVTVAGDRLGADNQFQAHFEKNKRYRFNVVNTEGDERVLGEYTAEFDGPISLEIGTISYQFSDEATSYEYDVSAINESGSPVVRFAYNDHDDETDSLTLEIRNRETAAVIDTASFDNGPYGEVVYSAPISTDQYNNETFVVEWSAERGGETIGSTEVAGGQRIIDMPLDGLWLNVVFGAVALLLAFLVGAGVHPAAGAITVSGWAGVAWFIGLVPAELGAGAVILSFAISIWMLVQQSNQGVPT